MNSGKREAFHRCCWHCHPCWECVHDHLASSVDVVEVARRTFLKEENIQVKNIKISSEAFENKEGKRIHVSAIEILLVKP